MEKKRVKRSRRSIVAAVLLMACFLSGCGKAQDNNITLTMIHGWGGTEADHAAMRQIYADFQAENPDIAVNFIAMPTREEMIRKVEDMIMVGDIPDIVDFGGLGYNYAYDFMAENGMLIDLVPFLQEDAAFSLGIAQANRDSWMRKDGTLYNVDAVLSLSGGYWYNEDILARAGIDKLPETWEEFLGMCEAIEQWAKASGADVRAFNASSEGYLYFADHLLAGNGSKRQAKDDMASVDAGRMAQVLEQLKELYAYQASGDVHYSYRDETSLFNDGQVALYINGVWSAPMISEKLRVRYALLPSVAGVPTSCESACMGYVLGKSNALEKEEAAVRFLKYMLSEKVQMRIMEDTGQIPANPGIALENYRKTKPRMYQAAELVLAAERKIDVPENIWGMEQKEYFTDNIIAVLEGAMQPGELAETMRAAGMP